MHICWRRMTQNGYSSWQRIQHSNSSTFTITLNHITPDRKLLPRINGFSHPYSSAISLGEEIWFQIDTDGIPMMYNYNNLPFSSVTANSNIKINTDIGFQESKSSL